MKLLAVPILERDTGKAQEEAVITALTDWGIEDRVQPMSFDTTSANSGRLSGACTLIEEKLQRKLLHLACWHHIHGLIIAKVFESFLPKVSSGPNIKIFQKFAQQWKTINKSNISGIGDGIISNEEKEEIADFIHYQLSKLQPKDDYRELLKLALAFLGNTPGYLMHAPGAYHKAS